MNTLENKIKLKNGIFIPQKNFLKLHRELSSIKEMEAIKLEIKEKTGKAVDITSLIISVNDCKPMPYFCFIDLLSKGYWKSDNFKQQQVLHLADSDTKHELMGDYLKNRSQKIGKKLTMQNGEEMTMAQWRALHNTSENKITNNKHYINMNKKVIKLSKNALNNIIAESVTNYMKSRLNEDEDEITCDNPIASQMLAGNYSGATSLFQRYRDSQMKGDAFDIVREYVGDDESYIQMLESMLMCL